MGGVRVRAPWLPSSVLSQLQGAGQEVVEAASAAETAAAAEDEAVVSLRAHEAASVSAARALAATASHLASALSQWDAQSTCCWAGSEPSLGRACWPGMALGGAQFHLEYSGW